MENVDNLAIASIPNGALALIGVVLALGLIIWLILQTMGHEKRKRDIGSKNSIAELEKKHERQFEQFFGSRLLSLTLASIALGGAVWLSKETWNDITSLEAGKVESVEVYSFVRDAYLSYGAWGAKLIVLVVSIAPLTWWIITVKECFEKVE